MTPNRWFESSVLTAMISLYACETGLYINSAAILVTGTLETAEHFYLGIRQISNCCLQKQSMINTVDFALLFLLIAAIIVGKVMLTCMIHNPDVSCVMLERPNKCGNENSCWSPV
jgi:hypothetical protein